MVYSVVVGTPLTEQALDVLRSAPDVALVETSEPERIRRALPTADALIIRDELPIDAALLDAATRLKVIGRAGVSLAGFDMERATARGIIVMNTPGVNAISTAEYTFALMLALVRRVLAGHQDLRRGEWMREGHVGMELYGKTLGLVGLGRVGRQVAERALAFGMVVIAYDPYVAESHLNGLRIKLVGLDEIFARSDVISLHCAPTPETQHVLDAEAFAQVKPGVWIVNAAHGQAIHERALAEALQEGRVAGAALDVYAQEPPVGSPLVGLPNVIHTPHMGDSTAEAQRDVSMHIVRQVIDALRGVDYRNAVNMPFLPGRAFEAMQPYMNLAERIGALQHYLARGRIRRVAVEYKGDVEPTGPPVRPINRYGIRGITMKKLSGLKTVAAIATLVAATAISTSALANPFNPFEALFGPHREPVAAPAYANPTDDSALRSDFRRQVVDYRTSEAPGTIIVDTPNTYLYLVMPGGKAMRYGIGVGREGFAWSGTKTVERKAEWPDWTPPPEMIAAPALPAALRRRRRDQPARRPRPLSQRLGLPHPRHQRTGDHRRPRVVGLHPHGQRGRDRPLQPGQGRHQGDREADRRPSRRQRREQRQLTPLRRPSPTGRTNKRRPRDIAGPAI